jgi:hypothetical protein
MNALPATLRRHPPKTVWLRVDKALRARMNDSFTGKALRELRATTILDLEAKLTPEDRAAGWLRARETLADRRRLAPPGTDVGTLREIYEKQLVDAWIRAVERKMTAATLPDCWRCGNVVDDDGFCIVCGSTLAEDPSK